MTLTCTEQHPLTALEPNPFTVRPLYANTPELQQEEASSLLHRQAKAVTELDSHDREDLLDLYRASTVKGAFSSDYSALAAYLREIDFHQVDRELATIGRDTGDIVFVAFPKGHDKGCRYLNLTGNPDGDIPGYPITLFNRISESGCSLGFIAGVPRQRPEGFTGNWGASDAHIESSTFAGFELDPTDEELQNPERQLRILEEKCPELMDMVSTLCFSGGKSLTGKIVFDEPLPPEVASHYVRRIAAYLDSKAPELGADHTIKNAARIWRLPGDEHQTSGKRSSLIQAEHIPVTREQLDALLPEVELPGYTVKEIEVSEEDLDRIKGVVSKWPEETLFPLTEAIGRKRKLEGVEEGGKGRRPQAWSTSAALRDAMDILTALGVPFDPEEHDRIVTHVCETCTPPIEPVSAFCLEGPGNPDLDVTEVINAIYEWCRQNGLDNWDSTTVKKVQQVKKECVAKAADKGQKSTAGLIGHVSAEDVQKCAADLLAAWLKPNNFAAVQALRSTIKLNGLDIKAVECQMFLLLAQSWGVRYEESDETESSLDTGVFSGGYGQANDTSGKYLVDGILIRNEPNVIFGQEGTGKTLHALQMVAKYIRGEGYLWGKPNAPIADDEIILIIATDLDNAAQSAIHRYEVMLGLDKDPLWRKHVRVRRADAHSKTNAWAVTPRDLDWLHRFLKTNNVVMTIIDSLTSVTDDSTLLEAADILKPEFTPIFNVMNSMICAHSTPCWLHHTRKDGAFSGVPCITRKPSTVHQLAKNFDKKTKLTTFTWQQQKTRHGDEQTREIFVSSDSWFFVSGKDVHFDLVGSLTTLMLSRKGKPATVADLQVALELGISKMLRNLMDEEQEDVVVDRLNRANKAEKKGSELLARLPDEWKFPTPSRPTIASTLLLMEKQGLAKQGPRVKTATRSARSYLLTDAGEQKAQPYADALSSGGLVPKSAWKKPILKIWASGSIPGSIRGDAVDGSNMETVEQPGDPGWLGNPYRDDDTLSETERLDRYEELITDRAKDPAWKKALLDLIGRSVFSQDAPKEQGCHLARLERWLSKTRSHD